MDAAGRGSAWRERCSSTSSALAAAGALDTGGPFLCDRRRLACETIVPHDGPRRHPCRGSMGAMNQLAPATDVSAVTVGTGPLTIDDVVAVARHGARVELSAE